MNTDIKFSDLGLNDSLIDNITKIGYETPTPIQEQSIPVLLSGSDILGTAQTGTGKTAAFALPILSNIKIGQKKPQTLVLTPTRELAIQVSEAFQTFARNSPGIHILSIYGGADYTPQIRALKRGVHIVVGTPGRVMDHIKKGTLKLDELTTLVLDEADEMLRMGFIDDVEWILKHTPDNRQIALFSATMPKEVHRIAKTYLQNPTEILIKEKTRTATTVEQSYWLVSGLHKLDALTRLLEAQDFGAIIVFVRTKTATVEIAEKLSARGYAASALNGDIAQNQREKIVNDLKKGKLDILVATDVAARGLDVERISHVINYDIPHDTESYIHRIGRTGRAGKSGKAILFVSPRERHLLRTIERNTKSKIAEMELPTTKEINDVRVVRFEDKIINSAQSDDLGFYQKIIEKIETEKNIPAIEIAAGIAKLLQGEIPFFLTESKYKSKPPKKDRDFGKKQNAMTRFRLEVGKQDGVKAANIIGCIANEANISGNTIKNLTIEKTQSFVDLPANISDSAIANLKKAFVCNKPLNIFALKNKARSFNKNPKKKNYKSNKTKNKKY